MFTELHIRSNDDTQKICADILSVMVPYLIQSLAGSEFRRKTQLASAELQLTFGSETLYVSLSNEGAADGSVSLCWHGAVFHPSAAPTVTGVNRRNGRVAPQDA